LLHAGADAFNITIKLSDTPPEQLLYEEAPFAICMRSFYRSKVSQKLILISILFMIPATVVFCLFLFSIDFYGIRRGPILTGLALVGAISFVALITRSISGPLRRDAAELRRSNEALQEEIKERQRAEAALKTAEQRYRSIFENSVEGIFRTTDDGRYLLANPSLARICGYDSPEQLREAVTDIGACLYVDPNRRAEFKGEIAREGEVFGFESEIYHKNGSRLWISENAQAVYDEGGKLLYYEGTVEDITTRKRNEAVLQKAQTELLQVTRTAGMSEAAAEILHKVGNVLNSVNVSANCISEALRKSKIPQLTKAAGLIREKNETLVEFLVSDPKGRLLPDYIVDLSGHLAVEHAALLQKIEQLKTHLDHVKQIVAMQQNYAKIGGVKETVNLSEVVEDAIRLNSGGLSRHRIEVVREFDPVATANLDKHKVLQILVNLVRNAEHACAESVKERKQVTVRVENDGDRIKISVADNGIGIPSENMGRIFKHGFTTKNDGHGFGLHSCAITAKELGGTLKAHSDGDGLGAIFTLDLPIQR
jgi:PAS domain S-box-containing protein